MRAKSPPRLAVGRRRHDDHALEWTRAAYPFKHVHTDILADRAAARLAAPALAASLWQDA